MELLTTELFLELWKCWK